MWKDIPVRKKKEREEGIVLHPTLKRLRLWPEFL